MNQPENTPLPEDTGVPHEPGSLRFVPESEAHFENYERRLKKPEMWCLEYLMRLRYAHALHEVGEPPIRDIVAEERERKRDEHQRFWGPLEMEMMFGSPHVPKYRERFRPYQA